MVRDARGWRRLVDAGLVVVAALVACSDPPTAPPSPGTISVTISGLPPAAQPTVAVTGPESFNLTIGLAGGTSTRVSPVPAGTYSIVASPVISGGVRYVPTPTSQTVVVGSGANMIASEIAYAIATARLTVTVNGLPSGTDAGITVAGPAGFSRVITGSSQLDLLEPGNYTITAPVVQGATKTFRPAPALQFLTLAASATSTTATVAYGAGTGTLILTVAGLPTGTDAAIAVTGPDGLARGVTSSKVLFYLEAGSYTVSAGIVGSSLTTHRPVAASQTIGIADADTSRVTVTYGSAPLELSTQLVAEGLTQPVFLTAPDGDARLFIVERVGRIKIFANGSVLSTPFLDIRDRVNNVGERGLLSMAFDPQYASNGNFYVYYVDFAGNVVVERFLSTLGSDVAGGSGGIVISIPHGGAEHHGGLVAFGPDGMMYLAPGDGGCCGDPMDRAQNLGTLLGKLLRIDARTLPYQIPIDNPSGGGVGSRPEIWASGLRSPWRFAFDPPTGMLYMADVGQDAREEVNVVAASAAGINYGWRKMEGSACFLPAADCDPAGFLTRPVLDYSHADGCSVIGGHVYRGSAIPELTGHYLYTDFCRGWLRSFRYASGAAADQRQWAGISIPFTNSFGRDGAGGASFT